MENAREPCFPAPLSRKGRKTIGIKLNCLTPKPESALLIFPPGLQFIEALFGCWYAGVIAIPAYVPVPIMTLSELKEC
jgi:acyl-CoA synthetase (AMP-forming)/AMP-acid ligase II